MPADRETRARAATGWAARTRRRPPSASWPARKPWQFLSAEAAILGRLIRPDRDDLSADAARSILKLDFDAEDRARMHELGVKAQQGALVGADEAELASYRGVGRLLELMRSKARLSLKRAGLEP